MYPAPFFPIFPLIYSGAKRPGVRRKRLRGGRPRNRAKSIYAGLRRRPANWCPGGLYPQTTII